MKPSFHKVPLEMQRSFSIRHEIKPKSGTVLHYHPELELKYIKKGNGVRIIGDNINHFSSGEIILLGQYLPHQWCAAHETDPNHETSKDVEAIVFQFLPDFLGGSFLNLPEMHKVSSLFEEAGKGLLIYGETRDTLADLMEQAVNERGIRRLILLLSMFEILADTEEYHFISSSDCGFGSEEGDVQRLNLIFKYTFLNFDKEISLKEIASVCNLTPTYFCRYFKQMTNKTYNDFLTEVRIGHACRLLLDNKLTTESIGYECGFNNASNFFRQFRKLKGMSPMAYKNSINRYAC